MLRERGRRKRATRRGGMMVVREKLRRMKDYKSH